MAADATNQDASCLGKSSDVADNNVVQDWTGEAFILKIHQKALMSHRVIVTSKRTKRLRETAGTYVTSSAGRKIALSVVMIQAWMVLASAPVIADWPQINGPNRNGVAVNETLLTRWPETGLSKVWSHPVGQGNAGPVVVDDKLIVFHRPGAKYRVEALDRRTGAGIWKTDLEADYQGGMDGDRGPKCVPLVYQDRVFLYGAGGEVYCLNLADGTLIWKRALCNELNSRDGFFGVGTTPIVADGKLIVNAGGRQASIVALNPDDGELIWKVFDDDASYSSPVETKVNGKSVVVFVTRLHLVGIDPSAGEVVFQTRFGKTGPTVNAAMPVSRIDSGQTFLFVTAAYGVGARWLKVLDDEVETVWENDSSFSAQYSTPVMRKGLLFGTAGREDFKDGSFRCVDANSGKVLWKQDTFPVGHSILVGDQILVLDSTGGFHVVEATGEKFNSKFRTRLFSSAARSMPALSDGFFYARSNADRQGMGELACFEVVQHR